MSDGEDAATSLGDRTPAGQVNASLVQVLPLLGSFLAKPKSVS